MANFNFNKAILGGRLTADPELKTTPSGKAVTSFTVAVTRRVKSKDGENTETDFINCTAWDKTAEFITQYFRKGSSICVVGSQQSRTWTDQQGNKRFATDTLVREVYFVDSKAEASPAQKEAQNAYGAPPAAPSYMPSAYMGQGAPSFDAITDDDDLPF